MPFVIDMTGVSTEGPPPLDPDEYPAVITKAEVKDSKRSGNPTLYLNFAVGEEQRTMSWSVSLQQSQLWRLKKLLINLGLEVPDGEFEFDEQDLIGVECIVDVVLEPHHSDANRKSNKIRTIIGPEGVESGDSSWG